MATIIVPGHPINNALPWYFRHNFLCAECQCTFTLSPIDFMKRTTSTRFIYIYNPPLYPVELVRGPCPFCFFEEDHTLSGSVGTSPRWAYPLAQGMIGVRMVRLDAGNYIGLGIKGNGNFIPAQTAPPGWIWSIGRDEPIGPIAIGYQHNPILPGQPATEAELMQGDPELYALLVRECVSILE